MKKLPLFLILWSLSACSNETIKNESKWAAMYMQKFEKGMTLTQIYQILKQKKDNVVF